MKCDECGKNQAIYHSITKINGVSTERHLCADCHANALESKYVNYDIGSLFSGFSNLFGLPTVKKNVLKCSKCGTTSDDFINSGFVGCSHCYSELNDVIMPVIKKVQGDTLHTGKSPMGYVQSAQSEYDSLREQLQRAINQEDYESATIIRDKMRKIKGEA